MFKLVAMDLDGTLFDQHHQISAKNRLALEELEKRNLFIVIASGRTFSDIEKLVSSTRLPQYVRSYFICYNGVIAAKTRPMEILYQQMIHAEDVRRIACLVEPAGLKMHVFCEGAVYLSEGIGRIIESDLELMEVAKRVQMTGFNQSDEVYKVLILDDPQRLDDFQRSLPLEIFADYSVFKSASHLLEFVNKKGSKGDALAALAEALGILQEEIIAIGDEENDLSMFEYAGLGIAMGNSKPEIKKQADAVTLTNEHDGVAEAIHQYILDGRDKNGL